MHFDENLCIVIILAILGILGAMFLSQAAETARGFTASTIVLWLIGYGITCAIAATATSSSPAPAAPSPNPLTYKYVAEQLGFVSEKTYPLVLGERIGGSSGSSQSTTYMHSGLFTANAVMSVSGSTSPASAVSLGYSYEGKSYIIEIPTSQVTFIQSTDSKPAVTIWLNDAVSPEMGYSVAPAYDKQTSCEHQFLNLLPQCVWAPYDNTERDIQVNQHALDVGLSPIISGSFDRAEITLTPEMYNQLLGVIE